MSRLAPLPAVNFPELRDKNHILLLKGLRDRVEQLTRAVDLNANGLLSANTMLRQSMDRIGIIEGVTGIPDVSNPEDAAGAGGQDNQPPTIPGAVTFATSVISSELFTLTRLTMSWPESTDNSGSLFYELEYWTTDPAQSSVVETPFTDHTISPAQVGQTYSARVRASDYNGNKSEFSATTTFMVTGDTVPPANVSGITVTGGLDKVLIEYLLPPDKDFLVVRVWRGTSAGFVANASSLITEFRGTSYVDSKVVNGTGYFYKFATVDVSGNQSAISAAVGPATPFKISSLNIPDYFLPGAVTAPMLQVGAPNNLLWNSTFGDGAFGSIEGWSGESVAGGNFVFGLVSTTFGLSGGGRSALLQRDTLSSGQQMIAYWLPGVRGPSCAAGERWQFSAYVQTHRCFAFLVFEFYDAAGNFVGSGDAPLSINTQVSETGGASAVSLNSYTRIGRIVTAPAAAAVMTPVLLAEGLGTATVSDPARCYLTHMMLGRALPNQGALDAFAPGGITTIGGGVIRTNAIVARHITAGVIDASKITANTITSGQIQAGSITGDRIVGTTLSAIRADVGDLVGGTITGSIIRTGNILPRVQLDAFNGIVMLNSGGAFTTQLNVDGSGYLGFSPGVIRWNTLGNVTINGDVALVGSAPNIRSGKIGYADTASGFYLGNDASTPKFHIGSGSIGANGSKYLLWDGSEISLFGDLKTGVSGSRIEIIRSANNITFYGSSGGIEVQIGPSAGGQSTSFFINSTGRGAYIQTTSNSVPAVYVENFNGVDGIKTVVQGATARGFYAEANSGGTGVYGLSGSGIGVLGSASGGGYGVRAEATSVTTGASLVVRSQIRSPAAPTHQALRGSIVNSAAAADANANLYFQEEDDGTGSGNQWVNLS